MSCATGAYQTAVPLPIEGSSLDRMGSYTGMEGHLVSFDTASPQILHLHGLWILSLESRFMLLPVDLELRPRPFKAIKQDIDATATI